MHVIACHRRPPHFAGGHAQLPRAGARARPAGRSWSLPTPVLSTAGPVMHIAAPERTETEPLCVPVRTPAAPSSQNHRTSRHRVRMLARRKAPQSPAKTDFVGLIARLILHRTCRERRHSSGITTAEQFLVHRNPCWPERVATVILDNARPGHAHGPVNLAIFRNDPPGSEDYCRRPIRWIIPSPGSF